MFQPSDYWKRLIYEGHCVFIRTSSSHLQRYVTLEKNHEGYLPDFGENRINLFIKIAENTEDYHKYYKAFSKNLKPLSALKTFSTLKKCSRGKK